MKINIPKLRQRPTHMKCIHCDYEVYKMLIGIWIIMMMIRMVGLCPICGQRWVKCYRRLRYLKFKVFKVESKYILTLEEGLFWLWKITKIGHIEFPN